MFLQKIKNKIKNTKFYRMIVCRNKPIILEDNYGIRFIYYPWDHVSIEKHITRRNYVSEFEAMKRIIKNGDTVFDIGANIGLHSVLFNRLVGENGKVISFEPVPETYSLMLETLAINRSLSVITNQIALSDKIGSTKMNIFDKKHSVWNSLGNPVFGDIKPISSIIIKTDTLDNFCSSNKIPQIDFAKIDVEGFEKFLFNGANELLKNGLIKTLSFEVSKIPLDGSGTSADELFNILKKHEYKVYCFNNRKNKFEGPIESSDTFYDNYFASRIDLTKI